MKLSHFNNFITLSSDKTLGYNAFTRRYLVMPSQIATIISGLRDTADFKQLSDSTYQYLIDTGFIIDDSVDELATLDQEIRDLDFNQASYELTVNPTLDCNFKCWYCYEHHQKGSKLNEDIATRIKKHLSNVLKPPINEFHLSFFGGEPLMQFDDVCKPLIMYSDMLCADRNISLKIHFTSNSFLVTPAITSVLKQYRCSFQITLDGSREFHDKVRYTGDGAGSYDRILDNVEHLANHGIIITLRVNYTLGNIRSSKNIIDDLLQRKINHPENILVNFQRVWQDFHNGGKEVIKSLLNDFKGMLISNGIRFSVPDLINPRIESCYGDKTNSACINFNGDFYKCTARDFNKDNRCGHIDPDGNLIWDEGKENKWATLKFSRQVCRECRIAPICLSGCRQKNIEAIDDGNCPLHFDEKRKDELILQRFEAQYLNNQTD